MTDYTTLLAPAALPPSGTDRGCPYPLAKWDADRVAAVRNVLPFFWLCVFSTEDLVWVTRDEKVDLVLWTSVQRARERYVDRDPFIRGAFEANLTIWERFGRVLKRVPNERALSIDTAELREQSPNDFADRLKLALEWFDSDSAADFHQLLDLSRLVWNPDDRSLFADRDDELEYRLIGQLWPRFEV